MSPHIDFQRGGPVYTWSYRELVEKSHADTFVILGVAHQYCRRRFALTCKDFETPLGVVPTDRSYVDRIAALAGRDLFDDELSHRTEHSIEFQVVFLQYVLGGRRDFSIVPILVGSFHDLMERGVDPIDDPEVSRFVQALRAVESASGKTVAYIGGIDLCHVGPEFGDPTRSNPVLQEQVRRFDGEMLDRAAAGDPGGWFRTAGAVGNRWRVCGLAATYTMLHAIGPARGRLLKYKQALDDRRTCCVSFASMVFHASGPAPQTPVPRPMSIATANDRAGRPRRDRLPSRPRPPCPAPADSAPRSPRYDAAAEIGRWDGPRYRMTYRVLGQGPPLFLIPGIASTYRVYALLLNRLAEHFRTILYDYPGEHPDDGAHLRRITHDHLVDDLFGLIDHLNIGRAFLVGLSFGSTVVAEGAAPRAAAIPPGGRAGRRLPIARSRPPSGGPCASGGWSPAPSSGCRCAGGS